MRIVFMGTPEFASAALGALIASPYGADIVGVVTRQDKPKNRGHVMTPPPVKVLAQAHGIPVYQPQNLKAENFADTLTALAPDIIIVAAYGRILPKYVLDAPRFGCINIHGSLLPKYRGAAPIQRAIMAGEKELGITLMYMAEGVDTGDMIAKSSYFPDENDNFGKIHDTLAKMGADLLVRTLPDIFVGKATREKQDDALSNYAAKIEKEDAKIDFSATAKEVHDKIRALSPEPAAYALLGGASLKITEAERTDLPAEGEEGLVTALDAKKSGAIYVNCADFKIKLLRLIPEGKKEMSAGDFIRGRKIEAGQKLE